MIKRQGLNVLLFLRYTNAASYILRLHSLPNAFQILYDLTCTTNKARLRHLTSAQHQNCHPRVAACFVSVVEAYFRSRVVRESGGCS